MRNGRDSTRIPASLIRAAEEVLRRHSGLARTRDFEEAGIGRWRLSDLITVGLIERVRHGLYRAMDMPATTDMELVQACTSVPHGVVFLASALIHYGLTTFSPGRIWLAVEQKDRVVLPEAPPIELHFLSRRYHQMGVDVLNTRGGQIRIYDREKTLCDCLRFRNQIGLDIGLESLRNYLGYRGASRDKLLRYAGQCRVEPLMRRYLEAMG